jgi:predicted hotdog family 3-hydroxylacyl-ACP dehydratase
VLAASDAGVTVEKRVSGAPIEGLWLLELSAQAAAVWNARRADDRRGHLGYLVAARGWKFPRAALAGETLTITVAPDGNLGALARFRSTVRAGDEELASGELTCAVLDHV